MAKRIIFTEQEIEKIIQLSKEGHGYHKIPKMLSLKCSSSPVLRVLKENDIELTNTSRKYIYTKDYFKSIDTQEKAYWLGFLYADGNVYRTTIKLSASIIDKDHLVKFNKALGNTNPISTITQDSWGTETEMAIATLNSKDMCNDLIKLGCVPNKSLKLVFPSEGQVPKNLQKHFIRGYLDGDGSVSIEGGESWRVSMVGTYNMVESIKRILNINVKIKKEKRSAKVYDLAFGGNLQVLEKLNILYEDSTIHLARKHDRYLQLKNIYTQEKIESRRNLSSRFR